MTVNDGWAKASFRVVGSGLDLSLLGPSLGARAVPGPRGGVVTFPIADDVEVGLQQLLAAVEQFADEHRVSLADFRRHTRGELQLFLGWSPRAPQESVTLSASLLKVLVELGAEIIFDTYSE